MEWIEEPYQEITQGAIVDGVDWGQGEQNPLSIVLSNACDLENNKAEYLIVAALLPAAETLSKSKEYKSHVANADDYTLSKKGWSSFVDFLGKYIHNTQVCRYFFFDPNPIIDTCLLVVDFQLVKSIDLSQNLEYIGQMKQIFTMQMMSRFVSYTGRVPVDRPDAIKINAYIQELAGDYKRNE